MAAKMTNVIATTIFLVLSVDLSPIANATGIGVTIRDIPPTLHFAPVGSSPTQIAAAIKLATQQANWSTIDEQPGAVTLSLRIRSHEAEVVVGYDDKNYWISYSNSLNLDFNPNDYNVVGPSRRVIKGPRIHRNYNKWVAELSGRIAARIKTPPRTPTEDSAGACNRLLVADELEKLDALRQRGVLTEEEFGQQKLKLLAH